MLMSPPKLVCWRPNPQCYGSWTRYLSASIMHRRGDDSKISVLIKGDQRGPVRIQQERTKSAITLILDFPVSRIMSNVCYLYFPVYGILL
jgi:hypothetical protein